MNVEFILPGLSYKPIGGYRVVYEHANGLAAMGLDVSVTHVHVTNVKRTNKIRSYITYTVKKLLILRGIRWMTIDKAVEVKFIYSPEYLQKLDGYSYIATSWDTVKIAKSLSIDGNRGFNLIQGYENWDASRDDLIESYGFGLYNIAVSGWLQSVVIAAGYQCDCVRNGLNHDELYLEQPIHDRNKLSLSTFYHHQKFKGFGNVLRAVKYLRAKGYDIDLTVIGAYKPEFEIESWITYELLPSRSELRSILNRTGIFVSASQSEGWGLPVCEAMQCGCAAVVSAIEGHLEFSFDYVTALLVDPHAIESISIAIETFINNDDLRMRIAANGNSFVKNFDWEKSTYELSKIIFMSKVDRSSVK